MDFSASSRAIDRRTIICLRLRRADGTAMWVEVTARAEPLPSSAAFVSKP